MYWGTSQYRQGGRSGKAPRWLVGFRHLPRVLRKELLCANYAASCRQIFTNEAQLGWCLWRLATKLQRVGSLEPRQGLSNCDLRVLTISCVAICESSRWPNPSSSSSDESRTRGLRRSSTAATSHSLTHRPLARKNKIPNSYIRYTSLHSSTFIYFIKTYFSL
jgi:hypothetical protein